MRWAWQFGAADWTPQTAINALGSGIESRAFCSPILPAPQSSAGSLQNPSALSISALAAVPCLKGDVRAASAGFPTRPSLDPTARLGPCARSTFTGLGRNLRQPGTYRLRCVTEEPEGLTLGVLQRLPCPVRAP